MCNDYEQHVKWREYQDMMQALALGTPTDQTERNLQQADDIRINDLGPVMRAAGNGIELTPMRFDFPPASPKGGPVFNFRSEGRRFDKSRRCLIPASAFFEFTGSKYPIRCFHPINYLTNNGKLRAFYRVPSELPSNLR